MRLSVEFTICGQAFHVGTHPEGDDPAEADVVTSSTSSVEFGFAPEPDAYWGDDPAERHPPRRR